MKTYQKVSIMLVLLLACITAVEAAEVLNLELSDPGTMIAPHTQMLTIEIEKPRFTILKDVSLRIEINGSAQFIGGETIVEENFSTVEGDFSKDYEIELIQGTEASSIIDIKANLDYYESKKRYLIFGDRVKTEEATEEALTTSFTAIWTEVAPLQTELTTCKAEKETYKKQLTILQQEKKLIAEEAETIKEENEGLKKYKKRFFTLLIILILAIIGSGTYVWYSKFKK